MTDERNTLGDQGGSGGIVANQHPELAATASSANGTVTQAAWGFLSTSHVLSHPTPTRTQ